MKRAIKAQGNSASDRNKSSYSNSSVSEKQGEPEATHEVSSFQVVKFRLGELREVVGLREARMHQESHACYDLPEGLSSVNP